MTIFKNFKMRRYLVLEDLEVSVTERGVHYRVASREDIVAFLAIERDVYDGDTPWTFSHFEYEITQNPQALFLVAEVADQVVGFIGARLLEEKKVLHLTNLAVRISHQSQGIASQLITLMTQVIKAIGEQVITLEVRRDNYRAQGLYRRLGFETTKILAGYYDDNSDAVAMQKRLD